MLKGLVFVQLVGLVLSGSVDCSSAVAPQKNGNSEAAVAGANSVAAASHPAVTTFPNSVLSGREALTLRRLWGIEDIHVRSTASGTLIRFSYRVVDAGKAKILNEKKVNPYMIVKKTGSRLAVPETEKVGKLRQTPPPENGREYWMAFTNVGRRVKPGDHVDIVIGTFRAKELVVESSSPRSRVQTP